MAETDKLVTPEERVQERQRAAAREVAAAGRTTPADETEPGGRFIVNGQLVDADGKPVKKKD
jgi:hypothetical protein